VFKARAKHDHEVFLNNLCVELETDIAPNRLGPAFKAIRLLSGKRKVTGTTIHKSDGSPCLSEEVTLERWRQHFISALNHSGVPSNELDNEAALTPVDTFVCIDEPSVEEVYAAIKRLRNGRAPRPDGIPRELLKCAIHPVDHALHSIFLSVWRTGKMPTDWKDGIIVTLYKGKGPKSECSNYRPITLLSVPGKFFAHVILARIQPLLSIPGKFFAHVILARIQPLLGRMHRPQQSGFTRGRSTIDAILALRLLSEIHCEFSRPLNVAYLDIKAAFDSLDRRALWEALCSRGIADVLTDLTLPFMKILEQQFVPGKTNLHASKRHHVSVKAASLPKHF